jgi:hypothetical protein
MMQIMKNGFAQTASLTKRLNGLKILVFATQPLRQQALPRKWF